LKPNKVQRLKQPTPQDMTDACLEFLHRKFYQGEGEGRRFAQDRKRLLLWVVLWPATWLNERGVTIHGEAYKQIFFKVMLQADMHRSERIKYRPAWLRMVIQSHWKMHGEEYYEEAKSMRSVTEKLLLLTGVAKSGPDPVKELASARSILAAHTPKRTPPKRTANDQLNLFG
jgi:hypothetical protein